jgi:hypothetical protein
LLSQISERLVAFDGGQRYQRFEGGSVMAASSPHPLIHRRSVVFVKLGYHLSHCQNFKIPL